MRTFRKTRADAPPGFFEVEAAGLRWLAEADAVGVARVLAVGPGFLELERLVTVPPTRDAARTFGVRLAALHDAGAPAFGAPPPGWSGDGFIGDAPLPLRPEPTWGVFEARHRVRPYAEAAGRRGALDAAGRATIDRLCAALEAGTWDDPAPPARLHGDLWSGNVLFTPAGVTLIDPAAHGGHRLADLAMLALFGAPFLPEVLDAYADASVHLPSGWRRLIGLHQVHPLLVHAVLFGGGYGERAVRAAERALADLAD